MVNSVHQTSELVHDSASKIRSDALCFRAVFPVVETQKNGYQCIKCIKISNLAFREQCPSRAHARGVTPETIYSRMMHYMHLMH